MRRWLAAHRQARQEAARIRRLQEHVLRSSGVYVTGAQVIDAGLTLLEGVTSGAIQMAPPQVPELFRDAPRA